MAAFFVQAAGYSWSVILMPPDLLREGNVPVAWKLDGVAGRSLHLLFGSPKLAKPQARFMLNSGSFPMALMMARCFLGRGVHCPLLGFLVPEAAQIKRVSGSSGWFHYAANLRCCKRRFSSVLRLILSRLFKMACARPK